MTATSEEGRKPKGGELVRFHNANLLPSTVRAIYIKEVPGEQHQVGLVDPCVIVDSQGGEI